MRAHCLGCSRRIGGALRSSGAAPRPCGSRLRGRPMRWRSGSPRSGRWPVGGAATGEPGDAELEPPRDLAAPRRDPAARGFLGLARPDALAWLGEGSLSVVAQLSHTPGHLSADSSDLTAGSARVSGQLALDTDTDEPRVTGRIAAEILPIAGAGSGSREPLAVAALRGWSAAVGRGRAGACGFHAADRTGCRND